jgi:hypothetical protein
MHWKAVQRCSCTSVQVGWTSCIEVIDAGAVARGPESGSGPRATAVPWLLQEGSVRGVRRSAVGEIVE